MTSNDFLTFSLLAFVCFDLRNLYSILLWPTLCNIKFFVNISMVVCPWGGDDGYKIVSTERETIASFIRTTATSIHHLFKCHTYCDDELVDLSLGDQVGRLRVEIQFYNFNLLKRSLLLLPTSDEFLLFKNKTFQLLPIEILHIESRGDLKLKLVGGWKTPRESSMLVIDVNVNFIFNFYNVN